MTKEEAIEFAYSWVELEFQYLEKYNWINQDFFTDKESGFKYFHEQIASDPELKWLNGELGSSAGLDLADHIIDKLKESEFFNMVQQCNRPR